MISLFAHNEVAYNSAVSMLSETGKAAVVHPTGTGKSFIGFKLCEDNPEATVCWLSPSEYIFQTQLENLKSACGGYSPKNVRFFTYAKLMNMSEEDLREIQPNYIVLDEFHRAGAQQWQLGVQSLLDMYADVPVLGLSATHIRYLDNQRNMAEELFDGNIASEITLGEAIVRGILYPPKYVLSVFSCQKDLEKYQRRIYKAKNKAVQDTAQQYLEALRRALDKADGLDDIFDRHMTDRTGKYIVFCANYEHLCEMQKHLEWFQKIDKAPHIYTVYSEDPSASESFRAFREDTDTTHLRLLYAIDALNEGIHLDDIAGVILLRPTVSPIIYKQQIGRALSAGKNKEPIIFDIVNNIENLYSIDSVEREMENAILYFRRTGESRDIVNENFRVFDEVRECRHLFGKLNDVLGASWDLMYGYAKAFYEANHHLDIPKRYKTAEGYSLGNWIMNQRRIYNGEIFGHLPQDRVERLNAISMCWDRKSDSMWKRAYDAFCRYKEEYGNLDISAEYVTEDGFSLGELTSSIRTAKVRGTRSVFLTEEHEKILTNMGFIWDKLDYAWEQYYLACMDFKLTHGHLQIPSDAVSKEGLSIGAWVRRQRLIRRRKVSGRLSEEQIKRLDSIGFLWDDHFTHQWNVSYEHLVRYKKSNGHVLVPMDYIDETGFALGAWLWRQKRNEKLSSERKTILSEIGVVFEKAENPWELRYNLARQFYETHGHLRVPAKYNADGVNLNKWISDQRQIRAGSRKGKSLSEAQIKRLDAIGMVWQSSRIHSGKISPHS